jgi:hypothetical protein
MEFRCITEAELQEALAALFAARGLEVEREARLGPADRIDFLVDGIGVEVKTGGSPAEVLRQLDRYLASRWVRELLLITTRAAHRALPATLRGKPIHVEYLCPL